MMGENLPDRDPMADAFEILDRLERELDPHAGKVATWGDNAPQRIAAELAPYLADRPGLAELLAEHACSFLVADPILRESVALARKRRDEAKALAAWADKAPEGAPPFIVEWLRRRAETEAELATRGVPGRGRRDYSAAHKAFAVGLFESLKLAGVGYGEAHRITRQVCAPFLMRSNTWDIEDLESIEDPESYDDWLARADAIRGMFDDWRKIQELRTLFADIFESLERAVRDWGRRSAKK
jgi:hypothetical protein